MFLELFFNIKHSELCLSFVVVVVVVLFGFGFGVFWFLQLEVPLI